MLETILLALLIGKFKGYKLKPLIKEWPIYPIVVLELINLFLQLTIFKGNYSFIRYASILKTLYLSSFIFLIVKYKRYVGAMAGSLFIFLGSYCNKLAIASNKGKMPVFPTLSYITGYVKQGPFIKADDLHVLGNASTKVKFLTDIIDTGYCIMSIGDVFIRFFVFIIVFSTLKYINKTEIGAVDI